MATYTAGELRNLNYGTETVYGTSLFKGDLATLLYGGDIVSFTPNIDMKVQYLTASGSRAFNTTTKGAYDVGYNIKCRARADATPYFWYNFWCNYGWGSTTAPTDHLPSFTTQIAKTVSTNNYYNFYNGCKINKFTINATGVGEPLIFEADVIARMVEASTTKTVATFQDGEFGANATDQTGNTLCWSAGSQINVAGGGLANWYPKTWKLTTDNHIEREYGFITGHDTANYPVPRSLVEGARDIIFEATIPHDCETYVNARMVGSAITALTVPVGTSTITLSNGVLEANDFPELKHDLMEETIKVRFKSVARA